MRRTKFYDGFHEGTHNEIRERSQLETKFVAKNRRENHWNRPKYLPNWSSGATWGRLGKPWAPKLNKSKKPFNLRQKFAGQNRLKIIKKRKMSIKKQTNFWSRFSIDFSWILPPKTTPNLVLFSSFFENVDFVKNSVSPRREQHFWGSERPKIT